MSLKDTIVADIKSAMKNKESQKLGILRVLKGEIERNEQTSKGKIELSDNDIVALVKKSIQGVKETTNDEFEITVLEGYLPKQLSNLEMTKLVKEFLSSEENGGNVNMGTVMSYFKANYAGRYDGKELSLIVKSLM